MGFWMCRLEWGQLGCTGGYGGDGGRKRVRFDKKWPDVVVGWWTGVQWWRVGCVSGHQGRGDWG